MTETIRIIFRGRVQGVFFRAMAKEIADGLKIKGYARNLTNGDVELLAQGSSQNITQLEQHLLKTFLCHIAQKEAISDKALFDFKVLRKH